MYILKKAESNEKIKAALFDFDGTLSTLRYGWESVMQPMMVEFICGGVFDAKIEEEVIKYIDESTGIQTIFQMEWLAERIQAYGKNKNASTDAWWYKAEYIRRLMQSVEIRKQEIQNGTTLPTKYLMKGSENLLKALYDRGVAIYVASGTDDADVKREADLLGLLKYFTLIAGAPEGKKDCSKEAILKDLIHNNNLSGGQVAVFGDGKVEIALGCEVGATTIGVASDEENRFGINPVKEKRLVQAGAHCIIGDFSEAEEILKFINL
jgi:phosphoglycolate phosphatase-like HAD superfamily hydrolase